ncbi:Hypothetical protein GbCGDNIH9_8488 [Granulibacter bethesdensis]|uniref:Uncharacterized protein n=1 Tax=Granulibacter bethesdensis TaxID=364410 RepID=A0AAC9KDY4_9PROT|nr:Hypothetical protein GbCGDNIH9_8488 [Granulibacter bethesdensis]APH61885.1 Hypothetical protein GbCGDNIH8_8488 [Granulibacter bethesdensis]
MAGLLYVGHEAAFSSSSFRPEVMGNAQAGNIACKHVDFDIHAASCHQGSDGRDGACMRNDIDAEDFILNLVHGEGNPVDRNAAFLRDIARKMGWGTEAHSGGAVFRQNEDDLRYPVHMAGDDMAAQFIPDFQGAFEVDHAVLPPASQRCFGERFCRYIGYECGITGKLNHRQAAAGTGNGGTGHCPRQKSFRRGDGQPHIGAAFQRADRGN